jgi:hypothetical protein
VLWQVRVAKLHTAPASQQLCPDAHDPPIGEQVLGAAWQM